MRLVTDTSPTAPSACRLEHHLDLGLPHPRGGGDGGAGDCVYLSNAKAYVRAALSRGLEIDAFAPRLSFFFACHNDI
jgi:methylmalonyl-CoA mutase N-terminal domain/subunit